MANARKTWSIVSRLELAVKVVDRDDGVVGVRES
jgi:hypothetical protein